MSIYAHNGKRLREGGVVPEMRSPVGFMARILHATGTSVKVNSACREQRR